MSMTAMRDAFGKHLLDMGTRYPELVVLDADVSGSTRTGWFGERYPDKFYNVGVAEANLVDIAAGMATAGYHPVISTFSLFLALKGTDQIRNVLCYNSLPVIIAGGYGGLSDSFDGASHQSITDIAIMRSLPNMTVLVPGDAREVEDALETAMSIQGPVYIRLSRNETPELFRDKEPLELGKARTIKSGKDITFVVSGVPTYMAMEAADILQQENIDVEILEFSSIKPIDETALVESARRTAKVLSIEEHNIIGGLGSACAEVLAKKHPARMDMIGINDTFTESGPYHALLDKYGISVQDIVTRAKALARQ
jgi:transketolase